jgi:copper(I)-binding protein
MIRTGAGTWSGVRGGCLALCWLLAGCGGGDDHAEHEHADEPGAHAAHAARDDNGTRSQRVDAGPVQLQIDDAVVHRPIADRNVTVGYFEIINHGEQPVTLVGAESPVARRIEIHTHIDDGGMMRMRPLPELPLPTGERVVFAPGGHHLMIQGVESIPERAIDVTLHFADAPSVTVPFRVRDR